MEHWQEGCKAGAKQRLYRYTWVFCISNRHLGKPILPLLHNEISEKVCACLFWYSLFNFQQSQTTNIIIFSGWFKNNRDIGHLKQTIYPYCITWYSRDHNNYCGKEGSAFSQKMQLTYSSAPMSDYQLSWAFIDSTEILASSASYRLLLATPMSQLFRKR